MAAPIQRVLDLGCSGADLGTGPVAAGAGVIDAPSQRLSVLVHTIERDIIPRLMLAHGDGVPRPVAPATAGAPLVPSEDDVEAFTALLVAGDAIPISHYVRQLRDRGVAVEALLLGLLAPSARRLGRMWEMDQCDFMVVTMGLWRLQRLLQELGRSLQLDAAPPADGRRILLTAVPGEQHTFGVFMVAEFFRRAGWEAVDAPFDSVDELAHAVQNNWYSIVGLSIAGERWVERLKAAIAAIRRHTKNPGISIIAGGPLYLQQPELLANVGADAVATDARRAIELAQSMVSVQRLAS